jgi:type II secretory pathway component PulF
MDSEANSTKSHYDEGLITAQEYANWMAFNAQHISKQQLATCIYELSTLLGENKRLLESISVLFGESVSVSFKTMLAKNEEIRETLSNL